MKGLQAAIPNMKEKERRKGQNRSGGGIEKWVKRRGRGSEARAGKAKKSRAKAPAKRKGEAAGGGLTGV